MAQTSGDFDRAVDERPATIVAAGVQITGDIKGATDLQVYGQIVGKVTVADLLVGDQAVIDGPVVADAVTISGRVVGQVKAQSVHLASSARMEGDVSCGSIRIDAGARFTGRCSSDELFEHNVVPMTATTADGDQDLAEAGSELLRLAARLRRVS